MLLFLDADAFKGFKNCVRTSGHLLILENLVRDFSLLVGLLAFENDISETFLKPQISHK